MKNVYRFPGSTTVMGPCRVYPAWMPEGIVNFLDAREWLWWLFTAALLLAVSTGVRAQTSCTYDTAGDVLISHCTLADGSGVDTWDSPTSHTETDYTPAEWTKRLATLAKADKDYTGRLDAMQARWTALDNSNTKKACDAINGVWEEHTCVEWSTYIETLPEKQCAKNGGMWEETPGLCETPEMYHTLHAATAESAAAKP